MYQVHKKCLRKMDRTTCFLCAKALSEVVEPISELRVKKTEKKEKDQDKVPSPVVLSEPKKKLLQYLDQNQIEKEKLDQLAEGVSSLTLAPFPPNNIKKATTKNVQNKPSSSGSGGLLHLIAYGAQDIFLTGKPRISSFNMKYVKKANFSTESVEQTFTGTADFRKTVTCTFPQTGDFYYPPLVVKLPPVDFKPTDTQKTTNSITPSTSNTNSVTSTSISNSKTTTSFIVCDHPEFI